MVGFALLIGGALCAGIVHRQSDPNRDAILDAGAKELYRLSGPALLDSPKHNMWRLNLEVNNPSIRHTHPHVCSDGSGPIVDRVELKYVHNFKRDSLTLQRIDTVWSNGIADWVCNSQ